MLSFSLLAVAQATNSTAGAGCTKEACPFSFTNPSPFEHEGRCGEVDAAPRMPADIWDDQRAVEEYVEATLTLYHVDGAVLSQQLALYATANTQTARMNPTCQNTTTTAAFVVLSSTRPSQ